MKHNATQPRGFRSSKLEKLGSAIFSELADWKRAATASGKDVIGLDIGSPDQPPDQAIRQVLADAALRSDTYAYPSIKGDLAFCTEASKWLQDRFGVNVDPATEMVSLYGSQDGLAHLAMAVCDEGDTVLLPDPGYPIYGASLVVAGVVPALVKLRAENDYLPDLDELPDHVWDEARFIMLNYPNNPLSAVANLAFFEQLVAKARKHNVLVVHDLAYSEMAFDGHNPPSIFQVEGAKDIAVEFHSLSKSFHMAGARIGFLAGNAEAVGALRQLKANLDYGIFEPVQEAGIAALREAMNKPSVAGLYERRRDRLIAELHAQGWHVPPPKATMFVWAKLPEMTWLPRIDGQPATCWSDRLFTRELLAKTGVAVVPGSAFGEQGEGYVRLALVESEDRLQEAARRIGAFISSGQMME